MKIGQIDNNEVLGKRDAFHVPCILANSPQDLKAGDKVRFIDDTYKSVIKVPRHENLNPHGIVDPFVKRFKKWEQFLVWLMPETVVKLNHNFELNMPDVPKAYMDEPDPIEEEENTGCRGCY